MIPNQFVYAEHREVFRATQSILQVTSTRFDNQLKELRELHVNAVPESKKLKSQLGSVVFRIVENTDENPSDKYGNPIVGGVNSFPPPIHVVLFVTPGALALLNQRELSGNYLITIYPESSILTWDQNGSIPIYESTFLVDS